ncbi:MAG TPA: fructosamine kinase, partial [Mycobacterium sp.]|nr:fructosamine kinase [Mycobacterium sp.]
MTDFVKHRAGAPAGFFDWEAAGLRWLSDVDDGVPCAQVVSVDATSLTLRRLESVTPSPEAADAFGRRLAITHDAGAAEFGAGPDGWDGPGFFGPLAQPLPMSLRPHPRWGDFYAAERLSPMA